MSNAPSASHHRSTDPIIQSIADRTRRETLRSLLSRPAGMTIDDLATLVTAAVSDTELVAVTRESRRPIHTALVHTHILKLVDAGVVERDTEAGTVAATDHPVLQDDRFRELLAVEGDDWDHVLTALRSPKRRRALAVLEDADAVDCEELARRVVARETDSAPANVPDGAVEETLIALHHVHIPALQHAGLVVYDGETARYVGHPDLAPEWLDFHPSEVAAGESPGSDTKDVWTMDGRENVIARGQELFDRADEELFLMFTTDGLLEDGCLRRLRRAIDRGVDVYLGSQTEEVRELVREEAPGVTIWEPQMDWLNLPPNHEKLGRLVFADREAVMLATLGEQGGEHYRETAVTGEGPDNSLVVLLRELLGSRLDHLDAQSEDFLSQIPL